MAAFIKEKFEELKKEFPEDSNIDLYAKAKAAYTEKNGDVKTTVKKPAASKIILESETEASETETSDSEVKPKAQTTKAGKKGKN
jgi:hypothetical protein